MREALCLGSVALLSETGLGEGKLGEAMGRLSAVSMDESVNLTYDKQFGGGGGSGG